MNISNPFSKPPSRFLSSLVWMSVFFASLYVIFGWDNFIFLFSFLSIILVVVGIHEWGHYIAARMFGVNVVRFSIGFGKPILARTDKAGTEWVLAPIPLGGYVRLLDRRTAIAEGVADEKTMEGQNNFRRFIIYAAGPIANLVLSVVIMSAIYMVGETNVIARIGEVTTPSPAAKAGLAPGDVIVKVNGEEASLWSSAMVKLVDAALSENEVIIETTTGEYYIPAGEIKTADLEHDVFTAFGAHPDFGYITRSVDRILENSPASRSGIQPGDEIVALDNTVPESWRQLQVAIETRPGKEVTIVVWREEQAVTLIATLGAQEINGVRTGVFGIIPNIDRAYLTELVATVRMGPVDAVARAVKKTSGDMTRTFRFLVHILTGELSFQKNISGPVGIAKGASVAASAGWIPWWMFVALISVSLAAVNLLPLPILDGGQMVICIIQSIMRRPLSEQVSHNIDRAGLVLILLLMGAAITADLARL